MLVNTMTDAEVDAAVRRDYELIKATTFPRLHLEYCKERQKLKIDKAKHYAKWYTVKTAAKNNWMILVTKLSSAPKHRGLQDQVGCAIVYYYAKEGYRFFRAQDKDLDIFTGHFFTRYNQRMNLNLPNHFAILKVFFEQSAALQPTDILKDGERFVSLCKHGLALGEFYAKPARRVYKTFVTHDQKHNTQVKDVQQLKSTLQQRYFEMAMGSKKVNKVDLPRHRAATSYLFKDDPLFSKTLDSLSGSTSGKVVITGMPTAMQDFSWR